jgi:hypothetical protein
MSDHDVKRGNNWAKMPFGEFVRRTPVGLLLAVTLALLSAGFTTGAYLAQQWEAFRAKERTRGAVEECNVAAGGKIRGIEEDLRVAKGTAGEMSARSSRCLQENTQLIKNLATATAERGDLASRVSVAEKALATRQCPAPVLNAYFVNQQPAIGSVEVCLARSAEIFTRRGGTPNTVGGSEVQAFISDEKARFYCHISCSAGGTTLTCKRSFEVRIERTDGAAVAGGVT